MIPATQLYRCTSCARNGLQPHGAAAPCEFCGGALLPVWGLGQLAKPRDDHDWSPAVVAGS
jgi:hypothetical protein